MATIKSVVRVNRISKKGTCKIEFALCHNRKTVYIDSGLTLSVSVKDGEKVVNFANGAVTSKEEGYVQKNLDMLSALEVYEKRLKSVENVALRTADELKGLICSFVVSKRKVSSSASSVCCSSACSSPSTSSSESSIPATGASAYEAYEVPISINDVKTDRRNGKALTLFKAAKAYIEELESEGRNSYANGIRQAMDRFRAYHKSDIPLADLTPELLGQYQRWLRKQPALVWKGPKIGLKPKLDDNGKKVLVSECSVTKYLAAIKTLVNKGIVMRKVRYDVHPFASVRLKKGRVRMCDLDVEQMKLLMAAETKTQEERVAQDCFTISFNMCGMNMADIMRVKWNGKNVNFCRKKTESRVNRVTCLPIPDKIRPILDRYMDNKGYLKFPFPEQNMKYRINCGLKHIAKRVGVEVVDGGVSMTVARKSWAQYAGILGIQRYVVDYCLGHALGNEIADHYQRACAMQAAAASRAVASFFEDPSVFEKMFEFKNAFFSNFSMPM